MFDYVREKLSIIIIGICYLKIFRKFFKMMPLSLYLRSNLKKLFEETN